MDKAATAMSYDELRGAIAQRHRALSGRLQQIAEFVLDHPTEVALGTVAEVAERSGVPPSAIVRFAHALGFGGFTQMQQVFRSRLVAGVAPSYKARLARMKHEEKSILGRKPAAVLGRFVAEAQSALAALSQSAHARELEAATAILAKARDIYLLGLGGSFPVATHLAYVLRKLGRRVVLLDGIGGSIHEQSHPATSDDALVAISFPELVARRVPAISITDSLLSPIVEGATVVFEIQDMPEPALRTLVAPMCLVQALAIGLDLAAD
jgi:DNA-binding MurR/RpiR family transcriptional regulator